MALDLHRWAAQADEELRTFLSDFETRQGYPPGANEVRLAAGDPPPGLGQVPGPVRDFFTVVEEVSWPDVWNGYFLGPASVVAQRFAQGEVVGVTRDDGTLAAVAIGSDGGGSWFVVEVRAGETGQVLHVVEAALHEGVLTGEVHVVAGDLEAFLTGLLDNLSAVVAGRRPSF